MKYYFLLFCLILSLSLEAKSKTTQVSSIHEIIVDLSLEPKEFWLIIDLDDTIIQGCEAATQFAWLEQLVSDFQNLDLSPEEALQTAVPFWLEMLKRGSSKLVENDMPLFIQKMLDSNVPLLIYTERPVIMKSISRQQLRHHNINISSTSLKFPKNNNYIEGIFFSGEIPKATAIQKLLASSSNLPKKIIFIDNSETAIQSVKNICEKLSLDYWGILYKASKYNQPLYNKQIAEIQYGFSQHLLSNEGAALLLRHNILP